jgi:hypothetical protein
VYTDGQKRQLIKLIVKKMERACAHEQKFSESKLLINYFCLHLQLKLAVNFQFQICMGQFCVLSACKKKLFPDVFWGQIVEWYLWKAYSRNLQTYKTNEGTGRCATILTWIFQLLLHMAAHSQSSWNFIDAKMIRSANDFSSTSVVTLFP